MPGVKVSHLAGKWYPADATELQRHVDGWLHEAAPSDTGAGRVRTIIVPHAGYQYSGRAAAAGYACVRSTDTTRVVVLAPSHYVAFRGAALLDVDAFATPLGELAVDAAAVAEL